MTSTPTGHSKTAPTFVAIDLLQTGTPIAYVLKASATQDSASFSTRSSPLEVAASRDASIVYMVDIHVRELRRV